MHRLTVALACVLTACGGATPAAVAPDEADETANLKKTTPGESEGDEEEEEEAEEEAIAGIPTKCRSTKDGKVCVPPKKFVEKLCQDVYPNTALVMFREGTPWVRGYLTRKTKAWNASGGASADDMLPRDEEVIIVRYRPPPKGGMQVSGAGGYDALRWDGSCVTLAMEEVTMDLPPKKKTPILRWRVINPNLREALRTDEEITATYRARKKECKGVEMGAVSKKCEKLTIKLSDLIVAYVRGGGALPTPERLPE